MNAHCGINIPALTKRAAANVHLCHMSLLPANRHSSCDPGKMFNMMPLTLCFYKNIGLPMNRSPTINTDAILI